MQRRLPSLECNQARWLSACGRQSSTNKEKHETEQQCVFSLRITAQKVACIYWWFRGYLTKFTKLANVTDQPRVTPLMFTSQASYP